MKRITIKNKSTGLEYGGNFESGVELVELMKFNGYSINTPIDKEVWEYSEEDITEDLRVKKILQKRAEEYPSLRDFADAYYKSLEGDNSELLIWKDKCKKVKLDNPK